MDGRTTRRREKDGSSIALARWWYLTGFEKTSSRRWRSQWPTIWAFGCCLDKLKKEKDEKVSLLYESGKIQITHMMTLLWLNHEKIFFYSLLYEVSVHTLSYHCMLALFFWKNCQLTGNHKFFGSCLEFFNSSVTNQEEDVLKMLSINHYKRNKHTKTQDFRVPALIFDVLVNWLPAHTQFSLPKWRQTSCLAHILPKEQITEHNVSSSYKLQNN